MAEKHFIEQKSFTTGYLIPFFEKYLPDFYNMHVLEIGCTEAGFIDVLDHIGIKAVGLELSEERVTLAKRKNASLKIYTGDITDSKIVEKIGEQFNLIVMRDVIEHIEHRNNAFSNIKKLLKQKGYLYITFPPRFSAFAGHQQNGISVLRYIPYIQLLPQIIIKFLGRLFKENEKIIDSIIANYRIGLTVQSFENYCRQYHFKMTKKELFIFRPIFQIRFNISAKKIYSVPLIREFFTLGCECLLQNSNL
jgi:SAM-dependent methyltransferase